MDELVRWALVFGVIVVIAAVECELNGRRVVDPQAIAVAVAVAVGHGIGTGVAVWWFTTKGGPGVHDWWVAPACAALAAVVWVHLLAPVRRTP